MVTTYRHEPTIKSKCKEKCTPHLCCFDCPTVHYWYTHALVYNTTNSPIYVRPGSKIASVEAQYENQILSKMINKCNKYAVQDIDNIKGDIKNKSSNIRVNWIDSLCRNPKIRDSTEKRDTEVEFLHLDPIKDKEAYATAYNLKHKPPIPLNERKRKVQALIEESYNRIPQLAKDLLFKYPEVVHLDGVPFVGTPTVQHKIIYNGSVFFNKQYKTPQILKEDIKKEINKLLIDDLIESCESEYNNAYLPVAKRDEHGKLKLRLVLDLRRLNTDIAVDRITINDVQELINKLDGAKFMTVIDAASGYLQISLTEDSKKFTAFRFVTSVCASD